MQRYLCLHKDISKWMIFSDFCFGDKTKPNDAVSFVFVPYVASFDQLNELSNKNLPSDFKHIQDSRVGIDYLNSSLFFSITIILEKNRKLLWGNKEISRDDLYSAMLRNTIAKCRGGSFEKKLRKMAESSNYKLIDNILLTSFFTAFCADLLMRLTRIEKIGWFPDRDNIVSAFDYVVYDLTYRFHREFYKKATNRVLNFGQPNFSGNMWYDGLNKLPDYLAGTLADYNYNENKCSNMKHLKMLQDVFAVNPYHIVLGMKFKGGISFSRFIITKQHDARIEMPVKE